MCTAAVDRPFDVFISHAGTLRTSAYELEGDLHKLGLKAFVDAVSLHPGDSTNRAGARMFMAPIGLALINRDYLKREWPLRELKGLMEAGTVLPVLVGMSHSEWEQLWRASSEATRLGKAIFHEVARTAFVIDELGWRRMREKICFAVLRVFIEKVCPHLSGATSMQHIERALTAAKGAPRHLELTVGEMKAAARWVEDLKNLKEGHIPVATSGTSSVPPFPPVSQVSPVSPVSQAARILLKCTAPGADGMANLSHLPDLPGLALDRWLEPEGRDALRSQLCKGLRSLNVNSIVAISKLPNLVASLSQLTSISLLGRGWGSSRWSCAS